jgi:heptosyltransferase-3
MIVVDTKKINKILVVKMHQHGDVVLSSAAINAIHKAYPQAQIDAYVYKDTLPMLQGHPFIKEFITYDRQWKSLPIIKRLLKELETLLNIRRGKYDIIINLTNGDRGALVSLLSGCDYSYGIDAAGRGVWGKKFFYTKVVQRDPEKKHEVERLFDVLRCAGIKLEPGELTLHVPEESQKKISAMLSEKNLTPKKYVLLAPLSRLFYKCLLPKQMSELIKELHCRGEHVVLTGSSLQKEQDYIKETLSYIPDVPVADFSGKMSLKDLSALIQMSKCIISVDSVPVHIASAVQTPTIGLYGPTSSVEWGPWKNTASKVVTAKTQDLPFVLSNEAILEAFEDLNVKL